VIVKKTLHRQDTNAEEVYKYHHNIPENFNVKEMCATTNPPKIFNIHRPVFVVGYFVVWWDKKSLKNQKNSNSKPTKMPPNQ